MVTQQFEGKQHASDYQKFRSGPSQELIDLIFSYVEERIALTVNIYRLKLYPFDLQMNEQNDLKLSKPYGFAVDVGCGTGQNTRTLAPYFKKVRGIDISEAQIEEARKAPGSPNVTYSVCPAEEVPVGDASVDLLTASIAAHWFNIEPFLKEVDRILKPGGCLAIFTFYPSIEVHYKDCSEQMTQVFAEIEDSLVTYEHEKVRHLRNGYKEMYESIPYTDKRRIENILTKIPMSIARLMGFIQTYPMFHIYLETKPEEAKEMIRTAEERLLRLMGTSSSETEVEVWQQNVLILASKPQ